MTHHGRAWNARSPQRNAFLGALRVLRATCTTAGVIVLVACGRTGTAAATAPPAAAKTDDGITVVPEMLSSIKVDAVAERDVAATLALAGKVQFDEDRVAHVLAPLAGQIVNLHVKVGDRLRAGEAICAISSREVTAAVTEYLDSRNDLDLAEKHIAITRDLFEHEASSKMAMQQAENDLGKAQVHVARASEALAVLGLGNATDVRRFNGRIPIVSPIEGVLIERKMTEGQYVQTDSTPIATVANLDSVWVMGDLFERDLRHVARGQTAAITAAAYPGETFHGRVDYISDAIDPATRTAKVRVTAPNPAGRLKPEMFVSIALTGAGTTHALTVPAAAIFTEEGKNFVFVQVAPARFLRRPIDIEHDEGPERRVLGGLRAGDRIVTGGVLLLRQEEQQRTTS